MTKLRDLIPAVQSISVGEGLPPLDIRALSLTELCNLFFSFREPFLALYSEGQSERPNFAKIAVAAPRMVAQAIVVAAGDTSEGAVEDAMMLPGTVQLIALAALWKASVPDPKKLFEALGQLGEDLKRLSTLVQAKAGSTATLTSSKNTSPAPSDAASSEDYVLTR